MIGTVLCGGASTRMGADKAWLGQRGEELAVRVARQLLLAGCDDVVLVGGDSRKAIAAGWRWIPDVDPGSGPLGGLVSVALRHRGHPMLVSACDLPLVESSDLVPLAIEVTESHADVAVFELDGRTQWSVLALSPTACETAIESFGSGERSLWRTFTSARLVLSLERPLRPEALRDVDTPEDLPSVLRSPGGPTTPD